MITKILVGIGALGTFMVLGYFLLEMLVDWMQTNNVNPFE